MSVVYRLTDRRMNLHLYRREHRTGEIFNQAGTYTGGHTRPITKWELLRKFPFLIGATPTSG